MAGHVCFAEHMEEDIEPYIKDLKAFSNHWRSKGENAEEKGDYQQAKSFYSYILQNIDLYYSKALKRAPDELHTSIKHYVLLHIKCTLYVYRTHSYARLNQSDKELRDLNWIMRQHPNGGITSKQAITRRARIFLRLGNSAQALSDYSCAASRFVDLYHHFGPLIKSLTKQQHPMRRLDLKEIKELDIYSMMQCSDIDKYAKNGWKLVHSRVARLSLLPHESASMVEYNGKLYYFGIVPDAGIDKVSLCEVQIGGDAKHGYFYK